MKRLFLLIAVMIGILTAQAEDYSYLTFETTDGAKVSVSTSSLTITISGTTLTAGSESFTLSNLSKMYFSTGDESTPTGIEQLKSVNFDEAIDIYDLNGRKVVKDQMKKGAYIIKTKQGTFKIVVK